MYGNAKVTPAVHGCLGNSIFYQWLHFDYQGNFVKSMMKFEVHMSYLTLHDYIPGVLCFKQVS